MVKRLIDLFSQEIGGLHKAAVILAASSIASGFLGLLRDRLLAGTFGAGQTLDTYYAAFKVPDFLYIISLSIASVTVLIPFFLEKISKSQEEAQKYFNSILNVFIFLMVVLIGATFFLIPKLSNIIAPGFSQDARNELIILSRILLLSPLLLGLSNLLSTVIQSFNRFFIYALSPILYNVGIILGITVFSKYLGLNGIVFGVVLGAVLHAFIQVPSILKMGFLPRLTLKIEIPEVIKTLKLSFPRTIGLGLNQIVFIFITAIASFLSAGSIAVFNLSFNLQNFPLTVIGISYSVAAFPTLARFFANNEHEKFLEHTITALRQIIFWSIPISFLLIVLRAQIIRVLYGYGKFGWNDTRLTTATFSILALSLMAQAVIVLLVRAFYAAGKTIKPIAVNVFSFIFIVVTSLALVKLFDFSPFKNILETVFRVRGVAGTEMLALPLAFSFGMIINAIFLGKIFQNNFGEIWSKIKNVFFQALVSSVLMAGVVYASLNILDRIFNINTFFGIFFHGLVSGGFGIAVWLMALRSAKSRELEEIIVSLKNKFWKTSVIAPEPEDVS